MTLQPTKNLLPTLLGNAALMKVIEVEDETRLEVVSVDIAHRLRKACRHLTDVDFDALVRKMAIVQVRGDRFPA